MTTRELPSALRKREMCACKLFPAVSGGFVQSSQIDQDGTRRAIATLSLRIPSAKLDDGLARISKLANVQSRSQQTEDVTDQREALEAAVRDARADRAGLRIRLAKATTDKERSRLRALVNRVFSVDKEGQINRAELFMLLRVEIADERWQRAMNAIRESIRVIGSRSYVRFYQRDAADATWRAIPLDIAAV